MNEKQKEIMHEICKINDYGNFWDNVFVGERLKQYYLCRNGKFSRSLLDMKYNISKYVGNISAPTLDVCYHIKHKDIIVNASKDLLEFSFDNGNGVQQLSILLNIPKDYSFTLCFNGKFIDLDIFNPYEKYVIFCYVAIRLKEIVVEEKQKEKEDLEQKRKELINMFNGV